MNLHAKILDVLNENPMLHYGGFGKRNGLYGMMNEAEFSEQRSLVTKNESQVDQCLRWISINCEKRKTSNRRAGSYRIKHAIERDCGTYVSNGCCIVAFLISGFTPKRADGFGPNCEFNAKFK